MTTGQKRDLLDSTRSVDVNYEERGDSVQRRGKLAGYKNTPCPLLFCFLTRLGVCQTSPTVDYFVPSIRTTARLLSV